MHGLKAQALDSRQRREEAAAKEEVGQERPDEEAADLGRGLVLEDQGGTKPHDARLGVGGFEAVQLALHRDLVARVERGRGALGGPALIDLAVLGAARVGADRGGVDQLRHAGRGRGLEDAPAALDVDPLQGHRVPRGLDRPSQVDDRVGALEDRAEVGSRGRLPRPSWSSAAPRWACAEPARRSRRSPGSRQAPEPCWCRRFPSRQ